MLICRVLEKILVRCGFKEFLCLIEKLVIPLGPVAILTLIHVKLPLLLVWHLSVASLYHLPLC